MKNYSLYTHQDITNLKQLITNQAEKIPDKTAFQYLCRKELVSISYRQFREDINALGTFFYGQGLKDVKVAVLGENSYEWILTYFAVILGSNIIVPIDKELSDDEIGKLLMRCGATVLVHSSAYTDTAQMLLSQKWVQKTFNMKDFAELMAAGREQMHNGVNEFEQNVINDDDVCSIIFTSGTTGSPKGVMLSQRNFAVDAVNACRHMSFEGPSLLTLPLHHTFAFTAAVVSMVIYGVPICISRSLRTFNDDMQTFKPHHMFLVPLYVENMYKTIWKSAAGQGKEKMLKRLITISNLMRKCGVDLRKKFFAYILEKFGGELEFIVSGGAPISQEYIEGMDAIGIQVINGYGITECSPVLAVNRNRYFRKASVGLPLPCCQVKIQNGEICVKGPNIMLGYYGDEVSTKEVLEDGWFRTGDLGYQDEDGFLYITGRKKNLIIFSNGKNVSPEELEEKLLNIDNIWEVVVYAENETITAEIFAEDKTGIRENIEKLNHELPSYKRIQKIKFRDKEFDKTTTKKIKR